MWVVDTMETTKYSLVGTDSAIIVLGWDTTEQEFLGDMVWSNKRSGLYTYLHWIANTTIDR